MIVYRAKWILPISGPPIQHGWLAIQQGRVVAVESAHQTPPSKPIDLGDVVILPSLVNAHTHLEFSDLTAPMGYAGIRLHDWIGEVVRSRSLQAADDRADSATAIRQGLRQTVRAGVGLIGDIATTPVSSLPSLLPPTTDLISMAEVLGLVVTRSEEKLALAREHVDRLANHSSISPGISPHAPYSTPLCVVDRCIEIATEKNLPLAMHVAESIEERELIERGQGPFAAKLKQIQVYEDSIFPWGRNATLQLLHRLAQAPRTLIVHGNDLRNDEIDFVAKHQNLTVVYCPRTHAYFDHPPHPVSKLLAVGVRVALGTDSLASNPDLSLWNEVQWLLAHRQDIPWQSVLEMATIHGADALARRDIGRIQCGAKASLLTIPTMATAIDGLPESFLAHQPSWLGSV